MKTDSRELAILTGKYLDGTLDENDAERLESLLTDSETASFFLDNICADRILYDRGHAIENDPINLPGPAAVDQHETGIDHINEQLLRAGLSLPKMTATPNIFVRMRQYGKKYLAGIALTLLGISLLTLELVREYRMSVQKQTVAIITETSNCLWSRISTVLDSQMGIGPGIIELQSGLATLEFKCGAALTLESPSRLEIINDKKCYLHEGRVIVKAVPESAKGFIVDTPFVSVTDEGTKFSLDVRQQTAEVSVLEGQVKTSCRQTKEECRLTKHKTMRFGLREGNSFVPTDKGGHSHIIQLSTATHGGREAWVMADYSFLTYTRAQFNYPASENYLQIKRGTNTNRDTLSDRRIIFGIDISDLKKTETYLSVQLKLSFGNTELGFASVLPDCHYIVYGLTDETKDHWNEKEMRWDTLPGRNTHFTLDSQCYKPVAEFTLAKGVLEQIVVLNDPRLMDFIKSDTNGFVTFIVEDTSQAKDINGYVHGIAGRHHPKLAPPTLLFNYDSPDNIIVTKQQNPITQKNRRKK